MPSTDPTPTGEPASESLRAAGLQGALAVVAMATLALVLVAGPAAAHTELVRATPADGTSVAEPVQRVELEFSRQIELLGETLAATGPDGTYTGAVTASRTDDALVVTVVLDPPLGPGAWQLNWQILASDSHPRRGSLLVDVAVPATPVAEPAATDGGQSDPQAQPTASPAEAVTNGVVQPTVSAALLDPEPPRRWLEQLGALARIVMYLGLMAAAGLALFKAGPHRGERDQAPELAMTAARLALVAFIASILEVVLHVAALSGDGLAGALDGPTWRAVLRTGLGTALLVRSVGLTMLGYGGVRRARAGVASGPDALKLLGAGLAIVSFQFVGHTASTVPEAVVRAADLVHVIAAAVWVGGLLGLLVISRGDDATGRARSAARFSTAAIGAVVGVAVAGTTLALVTLPSPASVLGTAYGRVLLAKLTVVAVLGAVGAHSHRSVVPLVASDDTIIATAGLHRLHRNVLVEAALMVIVLTLTAVLVALSPR